MAAWLLLLIFPLLILSVLFLSLSVNGLEKKIRRVQDLLEKRFPPRLSQTKSNSENKSDSR